MKKYSFAALAILGIVLGSFTLSTAANAVYAGAHYTHWVDDPSG